MLQIATDKVIFSVFVLPIFRLLDFMVPKDKNMWAFAVHHIKSDQFIENPRAVFEEIKKDPGIKKLIFTRSKVVDLHLDKAVNTEVVYMRTIKGLWMLIRCRVIFVTHSISMDYSLRWGDKLFSVIKVNLKKHVVVNLWHGIPIKKLYALANPSVRERLDRVSYRRIERKYYAGLVASSQIDSYSMAAMFYPIKHDQIWLTGLPRNDFLKKEYKDLPRYIQRQIDLIRQIKNGKKLITYAPTYRQTAAVAEAAYYQFTDNEINELKKLLEKHNVIFGFRMHYFRNNASLFNMEKYIDNKHIFDLGHKLVSEIAPIIRESDIVITDYSSVYIEALYLNKPVLGFAYDLDHYRDNQDGLLYDMDMVFPGPVEKDFGVLLSKVEDEFIKPDLQQKARYQLAQKMFYEYFDAGNSKRVVSRVKNLLSDKQR